MQISKNWTGLNY